MTNRTIIRGFGGRAVRAALAATAIASIIGAAACGDSNSGDEMSGGDERQAVATVVTQVERDFQAGNGEAACAALTAAARDQLAGDDRTCAEVVELTAQATAESGIEQKPARIVGVKIDGDRATVSMSDAGRAPVDVPLVREDGTWKLANLKLDYGGN